MTHEPRLMRELRDLITGRRVAALGTLDAEEGTLLGFGIQDRGALHGRYLVLRQWQGGRTLEVSA